MSCNYATSRNGKRNLCPSASHEAIVLGVMIKVPKQLWDKKHKLSVMFCSHHAGVVKAKLTSTKGVNAYGEYVEPFNIESLKAQRKVADQHLATKPAVEAKAGGDQ
jgi:hypothetical protein